MGAGEPHQWQSGRSDARGQGSRREMSWPFAKARSRSGGCRTMRCSSTTFRTGRPEGPEDQIARALRKSRSRRDKPDQNAVSLERAKGIEPSYAAWEAAVLPLNYAREGLPP